MGTTTIIIVAIHKLVIVLIIRCNTADLEGGFIPIQRHHFLNNHTTLITLTDRQTHTNTWTHTQSLQIRVVFLHVARDMPGFPVR